MDDARHLLDALVEEPERRGVREHQAGRPFRDPLPKIREVDVSTRVRRDADEREPGHRHAGRVRAVSGVGDDDLGALLAPLGEVGAQQEQPQKLPLRPRGRLQRDGVEARHCSEGALESPHQLEGSLTTLDLLMRVKIAESRQRGQQLVDPRVVLHGAGAERVEARVDAEVAGGELREVAQQLRLRKLRKPWRLPPAELGRDLDRREVVPRERRPTAARPGLLVEELHVSLSFISGPRVAELGHESDTVSRTNRHDPAQSRGFLTATLVSGRWVSPSQGGACTSNRAHAVTSRSTSTRRSISAGVRFSVRQTSRTSSRPG